MKRSGTLKRKTALRAKKGMSRGKPLRSRPKPPPAPEVVEAMAAFKRSIRGLTCVVCGRRENKAYRETGYGHQAHHGIRRQVLERLHLDAWDARLAVCVCTEPCHRQITSTKRRLRRSELPAGLLEYVREHGLERELEVELGVFRA